MPTDPGIVPRFYFGELGKQTECKCPQCGKIHSKSIWWTGRGIPRIICHACEVNNANSQYRYGVRPDKRRKENRACRALKLSLN